MSGGNLRTGGQVLVDALKIHGVDTVFCVPGESYLAALDALHDAREDIRTFSCRQEGGAANMAEAYGKLTGRPGVLFVTRGPGACNAAIGVHTAHQDSTPMVVFIGQVASDQEEREAFQELDYRRFYGPLCKWAAQIEDPDRIPELVSQAFHRATSGRPGPVALALPEDMLRERVQVEDAGPYRPAMPGASKSALAEMRALLAKARRPLMIVGGGGWTAEACRDIVAFAEANDLPTGASFRCQDRFDNTHDNYVGDVGIGINPNLARRVRESDLILAVGPRLGEITTQGYTLLTPPRPRQTLIHVYPDPDELGRVYQTDLSICAGIPEFAREARAQKPVKSKAWEKWSEEARLDYLNNLEPSSGLPNTLDMAAVIAHLRECLPAEAILTTDAGNFSGWMQRFYQYRRYPTQLGPTSGAMGYGIPAAIAARLVHPDRPVVGFVGDGGCLMTGQEIATAVHYGIDPVILVVNNDMYGTIRMHQERDYPGRVMSTALTNPEFAVWAKSFGAFGELVTRTEKFPAAFERARNAGRIAVLELRINPELITTRTTLSAIREAGRR
ncbi:MAG TPA: thiamine pyrophosphate-binding protein [Gammaproteobacteria bacterium]|nr:thiamine pyrophosphate-binding protein [Gammaproteobacteria bacterium]